MKRRSRLLCWLLTGLMITTSCPVTAYAEQTTQFQEEVEQEEITDVPVEKEELENSKVSSGDFEKDTSIDEHGNTLITITGYKGSDTVIDLSQVDWGVEGAKVIAIGNQAFYQKSIVQVILPNTVQSIGNQAFQYCRSLTSVTFVDDAMQLMSIGDKAFQNCNTLTSISFGDGATQLETIGEYAFQNCNALTSISFGEGATQLTTIKKGAFNTCSALSEFDFPESLTTIGDNVFYRCTALNEVVLPSGLKTLGTEVFSGCSTLKSVSFSSPNTVLTTIPFEAFYGCTVLSNFEFPESLETISEYAFNNCKGFSKLVIPSTVTTIGKNAFENCNALTSVSFSGDDVKIETIHDYAFAGCTYLNDFEFPESLNSIGEGAFQQTGFSTVKLPAQKITVGEDAFRSCGSLKKVYVNNPNTSIHSNAFQYIKDKITIYANYGSAVMNYANENGIKFNGFADSISINSYPDKLTYYYNNRDDQTLSTTGFKLLVNYTSHPNPVEVKAEDCVFSGYDYGKHGKQTITVSYADLTATFDVDVYYNVANVDITGLTSQTYTGKPILPAITLKGKDTSVVLTEDVDYEVEYLNNTNVGTATVRFTGIGNYSGTFEKTFYIGEKSIYDEDVKATFPTVSYNGTQQKPVPVVTYNGMELAEDDFVITSYGTNIEAGTGVVWVKGKNNYTSDTTWYFTINPKEISEMTIKDIPDQIYTGSAIEPNIEIPITDFESLEEGKDYTVKFIENTENGTARVAIKGIGNYTGTVEKSFTIKPKSLANVKIEEIASQTYTGKEVKPALNVYDEQRNDKLVEGTDYEVTYVNNVNAGTATVSFNGLNNYEGTMEKTFKIEPAQMADLNITLSDVDTCVYTGAAQEPSFVATVGEDQVLVKDVDYTVSYKNNVEAGDGIVVLEGKGNYKGTTEKTFTINPVKFADMEVSVSTNDVCIYSGEAQEPTVVVTVGEDQVLVKDKDYTVYYENNVNAGTAKYVVEGKGNCQGTIEAEFVIEPASLLVQDLTLSDVDICTYTGQAQRPDFVVNLGEDKVLIRNTDYTVKFENNVNAGEATVVLEGKGNYKGAVEKTFIIAPAKLGDLAWFVTKVDKCVYTGEAQEPSFELNLDDDTVLVKDTDYTVSYEENVNAGTAKMIIEGKGNYKGTVEQSFTIEPTKLDDATVNDLPGYTYAGEPIKPAIDVKLDGVSLASGKDYTVKYYDNTNVGTATVIIEGKGNYTGEIVRTFDIRQKSLANIGIRNIPDHMYTGSEIRPVVSLELDVYTTLTAGVDYMVIYENNVNVGTATVKVQGIGNYVGTLEKTFKITKATLAGASVVVTPTVDYTGEVLQPVVSVVLGNKTLYQGSEYAVTYQNNKNIGTATVVVTGIGNYTGSVAANFAIQAKKGSSFYVGANKYKVTSASEVAFAGLKNSKTKKVTIPAEVKIGGKKFKVTSVANKALKGKAVTSVTVGKNVKTVGKSAFEKCSKLKKITFKGKALKKVNKKAFKGIHKNAVIKVPKKKLAAYKKLMNKKGQSSSVKIK